MDVFLIPVQSFGAYQAIDWLCSDAEAQLKILACRRIQNMLNDDKSEDVVKLGIVSRLVEALKSSEDTELQVHSSFSYVDLLCVARVKSFES